VLLGEALRLPVGLHERVVDRFDAIDAVVRGERHLGEVDRLIEGVVAWIDAPAANDIERGSEVGRLIPLHLAEHVVGVER
jgi:hypothetical protein